MSDLDGTLLRPDETIGERSADVINAYVAAGGLFTYATARSFATASAVTRGLILDLPVITYGGAVTVSPDGLTVYRVCTLSASVVARAIQLSHDDPDVEPIMFAMHEGRDRVCWVPERRTGGVEGFIGRRQNDPRLWPLADWSELDPTSAFYISFINDRKHLAWLYDALSAVELDSHVTLSEDNYRPGEWWLEITSATGTKAAAIAGVRQHLGADRPLICIGDNQNDLPMFAVADLALAVSNAQPDIRASADQVIPSNLDEGVACWLDQNWLR